MERIQSTRFSFRRKGSKNKEKEARERDATFDFDYDTLTYLRSVCVCACTFTMSCSSCDRFAEQMMTALDGDRRLTSTKIL